MSCTWAWDAQQVGREQALHGLGLQSVNVSVRWGSMVNTTPHPLARYSTHCIGGWVGPRAALDGAENLASTRLQVVYPKPFSLEQVTTLTMQFRPTLRFTGTYKVAKPEY